MKVTDLAILFLAITIPFNIVLDIKTKDLRIIQHKSIEINRKIDTSIDDGVSKLVTIGADSKKPILNKELAVKTFYETLYLNLGVKGIETYEGLVDAYIPLISVMDYDGYYIYANEEFTEGGESVIKKVWQPKQYFSYTEGNYVYMFTMDDYLTVYDMSNEKFYEGEREDLARSIGTSFLRNEELFDTTRRNCIVTKLKNDMNYYINKHNETAKKLGVEYQFYLPQISEDDWHNTINDMGMMVFLQGMPLGISDEKYNYYALGGARVYKAAKYYAEPLNGVSYYHRENCSLLTNKNMEIASRKQGAERGYRPCNECMP